MCRPPNHFVAQMIHWIQVGRATMTLGFSRGEGTPTGQGTHYNSTPPLIWWTLCSDACGLLERYASLCRTEMKLFDDHHHRSIHWQTTIKTCINWKNSSWTAETWCLYLVITLTLRLTLETTFISCDVDVYSLNSFSLRCQKRSGFPANPRSEIENELNGNKVQFVRKHKFHSM